MEFVVEDNCCNIEAVDAATPYLKPFLDRILVAQNISSLDYFVISDSEEENYLKAVNKYASLVGTDTCITQDGTYYTAGKSLYGVDNNDIFHQAIVIKSSIWVCAAYEYMGSQGLLEDGLLEQMNTPPFMSLALIAHEIGHVIDNEQQYAMRGTVNTKVLYNLQYEYDEYVKNTALSLWGEYFAESFAYQIINLIANVTEEKVSELEKCIGTYSLGTDSNTLLNRAYRILYLFVMRIAYIHQSSNFSSTFDYSLYDNDSFLRMYVPILARVEVATINLYRSYPHWESYEQLNELSSVFKYLVTFEFERQK